jgi:hypothetical protein
MLWQCRHPSEFPRDRWIAILDSTPEGSPYLLPEWSLFWEDVWPGGRAEVWCLQDGDTVRAVVPLVRRTRYGFLWRHAQPYGTPCGPILLDKTALSADEWRTLSRTLISARCLECTITSGSPDLDPTTWKTELRQGNWVIRVAGKTMGELGRNFSGSHTRNIEKGEALGLRVSSPASVGELDLLRHAWRDQTRAPRFILHPRYGAALLARFAAIESLVWHLAWAGERPVAGVIFLVHRGQAVSVDTIVDRDPQFRGAGHWLMADTLRSLLDRGVKAIDLGGAPGGGPHDGLDEFKSGWGATHEEHLTHIYRHPLYSLLRRNP